MDIDAAMHRCTDAPMQENGELWQIFEIFEILAGNLEDTELRYFGETFGHLRLTLFTLIRTN
jgi:hypothetical protein